MMGTLTEYLRTTRTTFDDSLHSCTELHFVIGNESCDLDSTVSSLTLAYLLNKHKTPEIPSSAVVIPMMNVSRENFLLRTENCFVLKEFGIPLEYLIYRNEINIEELLKTKRITTSLVDHHVLSKHDVVLQPTIIQIFDHRPFDASSNWTDGDVKLRIQEVGSCSTLIAEEILQTDEDLLNKDAAYIIYETIIYDTKALLPEYGRAKELDLIIAKKLEEKFAFNEDRQKVFDKLRAVHNDVSHLSPKQLLLKDLKIVENIPVPGLPMLVENFLKLNHAHTEVENMASEYGVSLLVLIGVDAATAVRRDVGIFWRQDSEELKNILLTKLENSEELKGYNFSFKEMKLEHTDIICLRQNNVKLSRKQIIPLIKDAILEYRR